MEQHRIDFESMEWEEPADGVRFKAYEQDGKKLRLVEFSKEFGGHVGYSVRPSERRKEFGTGNRKERREICW